MEKIPFYQVVAEYENAQNQRHEEELSNMRGMYPRAARRVLREVETELDLLEFPNSFMYHESPDRVRMEVLSGKIYKNLLNINEDERAFKSQSLFAMEVPFFSPLEQSEPDYTRPFPPGPEDSAYIPGPTLPAPFFNPRNPLSPPYPVVPSFFENGEPNWLKQLIDVLLVEEMAKRRRRRPYIPR